MNQPDPICPICNRVLASARRVEFPHGAVAHLDCYVATDGATGLVLVYLRRQPSSERFCYTCLAQHLLMPQQEIEKGATVLRLTRRVVVESAACSTCAQAKLTVRFRQSSDSARLPERSPLVTGP